MGPRAMSGFRRVPYPSRVPRARPTIRLGVFVPGVPIPMHWVTRWLTCALLVASPWISACGDAPDAHDSALAELEQLAFVPADSVQLTARAGPAVTCANGEPLLIDRFEISRGRWLRFQATRTESWNPILLDRTAAWSEDTWSWAATWMNREEARAFAASRGMRLPTAREWLRVALGTRGLNFPWGDGFANRVANTWDLGLGRPAAVGTFELGATTLGTYDMCGNVWEWVEEPIDSAPRDGRAWAMGGAYSSVLRRLWDRDAEGRLTFERLELDPDSRGEDVGFRCVVSAREYLSRHADEWGDDTESRRRLVAVGRRFGRDAVPLLDELVRGGRAGSGLRWLLEGAQPSTTRGER